MKRQTLLQQYADTLQEDIDSLNYELESEHTMYPWVRDEMISERDAKVAHLSAVQRALTDYAGYC